MEDKKTPPHCVYQLIINREPLTISIGTLAMLTLLAEEIASDCKKFYTLSDIRNQESYSRKFIL